jgi:ankyrin repeat protein
MRKTLIGTGLLVFVAVTATAAGTSLVDAIRAGNRQALAALLKTRPADVNRPEPDGTTALHWAARLNDLDAARLLVRAGANAKTANRYGSTPLELAAVNGSAAMMGLLLQAGADPNAALPKGETILMTAARTGKLDALKMLLAHGADANAKETWLGETALMWAAAENHADAVKLLAEAGADVNAHASTLKFAAKQSRQTSLPVGGMTPLMYAARENSMAAARALAGAGASLDGQDPDGMNALLFAIINGHYDMAALLLELGADPNVADSAGTAALYATVDMNTLQFMHGRPPTKPSGRLSAAGLVQVLLDYGADPNQPLKTPMLRRYNNASNQNLGTGTTPLMRAAKSGDVALMRLLIAYGGDPALRQKNGNTLLILASGFGRQFDHNADAQEYEQGSETELFEAVRLCVELGLDVNAANTAGETALFWAGYDAIKFLVAHGARMDVKNTYGRTAFDKALARRDRTGRQLRPGSVAAFRELAAPTTGAVAPETPAEPQ